MAHDFYSFKRYKMTDLERFSEQFLETEKEILVLMEKDTDGAMLFGQSWQPSNSPMAMVDLETKKFSKRCRLEWLVENQREWKFYFTPQMAYRLKVREKKAEYSHPKVPCFMLLEVLEKDIQHEKFTKLLEKYNQDMIYQDEHFDLKLEKQWGSFEGRHLTQNCDFSVETESLPTLKRRLKNYQEITKDFDSWLENIKNLVAENLLELAQNTSEKAKNIDKDHIISLLEFNSVYISENGYFKLSFWVGDLFGDHSIAVHLDKNGSFESAEVE